MFSRADLGAAAGVLVCVLPLSGVGAEPTVAASEPSVLLDPDQAVALGVSLSEEVSDARAAVLAAEGRLSQARGLTEDPEVQAAYDLGGGRTSLGVSQALSLGAEAPLERQGARAELRAAQAQLDRARLSAAATARRLYAEASVAVGRRRVAEEAVSLTERLTSAVSAKLDAGEASQLDLRLAHLAHVQSATWLLSALEEEGEALRSLAACLQQPVAPQRLGADPLAVAPWVAEAPGEGRRSDVRAALAQAEEARIEARLAGRRAAPPVVVGAFFEQEGEVAWAGPTLSIPIPLFNRGQEARGQAEGAARSAELAGGAAAARAQAEIDTAQARVEAAEAALAGLEETLGAEAGAALTSIRLGYDAGELDLPTALLLQRQALEGESAAIVLRGQVAAARIDWALANELAALAAGGER